MHYAAAVKAGKHVFMEKPCCVDAPGYRTLVAANEEARKQEALGGRSACSGAISGTTWRGSRRSATARWARSASSAPTSTCPAAAAAAS